jgi:hypothetical protein
MAAIYIACGLFILIGKNIFNFADYQKIGLGSILIVYGFFRVYSNYKKMKESEKEDED